MDYRKGTLGIIKTDSLLCFNNTNSFICLCSSSIPGNLRLFLDQIIKEMPAEHTYYQDCVNELILVFRQPNDAEEVRKEYTPDPVVITHNLQVVSAFKKYSIPEVQFILSNTV